MTEKEFDDLRRFVFRLNEELREYEIRFEALRVLLEKQGAISHADFDAALAEMTKLDQSAFDSSLEVSHQEEKARRLESLRDLLRRHEGTKQ